MNIEFKNLLKSKWATAALSVFLVMVIAGSVKLAVQKYEVEKEIKSLQQKAAEIQKDNIELSELIKYLNTPEYAERMARDKLNLKKEGEVVVSVSSSTENGEVAGEQTQSLSNFKKWYNYFFNRQ